MAEVLVIRLDERAPQHAEWIVVNANGERLGASVAGPLAACSGEAAERRVVVLIPTAEVLTTTTNLPVKSPGKIQQALPFALEEMVAEDVEDLHFAAGARAENGDVPVAVINRERFREWLDMLATASLQPDAVIPDIHGLARIEGTISLLVTEDQVLINDGASTELALPGVGPADAAAAIGAYQVEDQAPLEGDDEEASDETPRHMLVYCEPGTEETYKHDLIALRNDFASLDAKLLPDGVLPRLAVTVAAGVGINLLQGEFGAKTEYGSYLRPWRYAAILLLAVGLVGFANKAASYFKLQQQETQLRAQFMNEYRQVVPNAPEVADPAAAVNSLRARAGGNRSTPPVFLQSLEHLSQALAEHDAADVQAISYRAGVVDIRMSAPSVSVLDDVQRIVDEGGLFEAAIQSTDQDDDKVNSRIQIKAVGQ